MGKEKEEEGDGHIPLVCMISLALAEAPTMGGYHLARTGHDHSVKDFQRSLSQENTSAARSFGSARQSPSREYLPPNTRTASSRSNQSRPKARTSIYHKSDDPSSGTTAQILSAAKSPATKKVVTKTHSGFTQTNASTMRSGLSKTKGVAFVRNVKDASEEFSVPAIRMSQSLVTQNHPTSRSFAKSTSSDTRSLKDSSGRHNLFDSVELSSSRGPFQENGIPTSRAANDMTTAIASPYTSVTRSAPSNAYGLPSARNTMPSEQFGALDQHRNPSNEGYSYARDALDDTLNQEPASYDFSYKVEDYESGSDFEHTETRQDNRAEGSYFVVLPDGTKQVVEYEADEQGFKSRISLEPADLGRSGGYDDNAAELTRSSEGPY